MRVQNLHSHRSDTMQMWLLLTHNEIKVFLKSLKNVIPKPLSWFRFSTENDTKIFVRPIFRFWLLVSFGNEVTKIWKYYVIFVYILQEKTDKTKKWKKTTKLRWPKYQNPKDENMGRTKQKYPILLSPYWNKPKSKFRRRNLVSGSRWYFFP